MTSMLPLPHLAVSELDGICVITDDALADDTGVRVVFTGRDGGVSEGAYASLNLGLRTADDQAAVIENRRRLMRAFGVPAQRVISPNQVHGTDLVIVDSAHQDVIRCAADRAASEHGADGVVISVPDVAALLCFADCVPVVIVSPSGCFSVVHAGWRGVHGSVAVRAVEAMARADAALLGESEDVKRGYNVYLGPHIHAECFETGRDVHRLFVDRFGAGCALDDRHISLMDALVIDLVSSGLDESRILDAGVCTSCHSDSHFSYRASKGVCGRHGAFAIRRSVVPFETAGGGEF